MAEFTTYDKQHLDDEFADITDAIAILNNRVEALENQTPAPGYPGKPPAGTLYWGARQPSTSMAEIATRYEQPTGQVLGLNRIFFQTSQSDSQMAAKCEASLDAGRLPWISYKPGRWDQAGIRYHENRIGALVDVDGPVWLTVQHEPENDPDLGSPADYRQMQTDVRTALVNLGASNVAFAAVLMGYETFAPKGSNNPEDWWVDDIFDFLGVDPYRKTRGKSLLTAPHFQPIIDFANAKGVDLAFAEWGVDPDPPTPGQPGFIREVWDYAKYSIDPVFVGLSYWDNNNGDEDWVLEGAGLDEFRAIMGEPEVAHL